jgi:carbamate kinase
VDAVIDKDLASARLAEEVGVDLFIMATDVDGVALNFGKPDERYLTTVSLEESAKFIIDGHFSAGAMLPKVEAAMQFVGSGGKRAVITRIDRIADAAAGKAGTEFVLEKE